MTPNGTWETIIENMIESCKICGISYINPRIQVMFQFYSAKFGSCTLMVGADITFKGVKIGSWGTKNP